MVYVLYGLVTNNNLNRLRCNPIQTLLPYVYVSSFCGVVVRVVRAIRRSVLLRHQPFSHLS